MKPNSLKFRILGYFMVTKDDILAYLAKKKAAFEEEFRITKLGLFGSYARGDQSEESDIDLLIEFAPKTSDLFEKKLKMKSIIQDEFHKEVDLCREKYIKPYFKNQILNSAVYV